MYLIKLKLILNKDSISQGSHQGPGATNFCPLSNSGLLILGDVAISHNKPKIATNRRIPEKSQSFYKITQFTEEKSQTSFYLKLSDNLNVIPSNFSLARHKKSLSWTPEKKSHVPVNISGKGRARKYPKRTFHVDDDLFVLCAT